MRNRRRIENSYIMNNQEQWNDDNDDTYTNDNSERQCVGSSYFSTKPTATNYAAHSKDKQAHSSRKKETPIFQ